MSTKKNKTTSGGIKEFFRKKVVTLKRNPQVIPLIMLLVSFLLYSLNLTQVSNSTAKINRSGMGLCQFAIMLSSILSMVCMLNAYPRRKKANIPMIVLLVVMSAIKIYCSFYYSNIVYGYYMEALNGGMAVEPYIPQAYSMLSVYMVLEIVSIVLVLTLPLYSKLIKRINTSIAVEDNGDMAQIEIAD